MRVRVLWVVKGLGPGGAERLLVAAAQAHDPNRVEAQCAYVLPGKDHLAGDLEAAGVPTVCLSRRSRDLRWPLRLAQMVRRGDWDVVHVHSPLPAVVARVAARTVPARRRPAMITTEHNAWGTFRLPTRWANRLTIGADSAVFAVSDEAARSMSGGAASRVEVLEHGIDVTAVAARAAERGVAAGELGVDEATVLIGTVANFRDQKDYPTLLRAMRRLVDRLQQAGPAVHLVAVGQGPLEGEIRALAASSGLDGWVTFTGFHPDPVHVLAACDVFVLASRYEGLPVALMEATSLGLPVVATAVGGVAEAMTAGVDALLVSPGDPDALADALATVVTDEALRGSLGGGARRRADGFDVHRAVAVIEDAYARVAAHRVASTGHLGDDTTAGGPTPPSTIPSIGASSSRRGLDGIEIRPATESDAQGILALAELTLGWRGDDRFRALYAWKHETNAFGPSPVWVAVCDGEVVGLRAFMRWRFRRGDQVLRAVRAVDTATHPDHQGKGLFTAMTLNGLDALAAEGVDLVFNTPNDQSLPGYLKMGWTVVGELPVAVLVRSPTSVATMARSRTASDLWSMPLEAGVPFLEWLDGDGASLVSAPGRSSVTGVAAGQAADVRSLRTDVDADVLRWRFGTPLLGYRVVSAGEGAVVVRMRRRGRAAEVVDAASFGAPDDVTAARRLALRASGADYLLRLGEADWRRGEPPLPGGGPTLTFRSVSGLAMPPLPNWSLSLGDVELF